MNLLIRAARKAICDGCGCFCLESLCTDCEDTLELWPNRDAVFVYDGPVQHIVLDWKERRRSCATLLRRVPLADLPSVDYVAPVPPAFWRTLRRGVHPPDELARFLAKRIGAKLCSRPLRRLDDTPQMGKGARARRERSGPMFEATRWARALAGKSVLLVDDVRTTGTTLKEAAQALRDANVGDVLTLALAAAL